MKDTHEELVRCLRAVGVTCDVPVGVGWPVFEDDYLKFMGGPEFDLAACNGFAAWLAQNGYTFERHRDRAVRKIDPRAVERINVLWRLRPDSDETFPLPHDWDLYCDADGDWCLLAPAPIVLVSEVGEPLILSAVDLDAAIDEALGVLAEAGPDPRLSAGWAASEQATALGRGWGLFVDPEQGLCVQRSPSSRFSTDQAALAHVTQRALAGDVHARCALDALARSHGQL